MNNPFDKESWTEQEKEIINAGGWQCSFCGSINASYVTSCACGHNQDDSYENLHGRYVPRPDEEYTEQQSIGETVASATVEEPVEGIVTPFEEIPDAPVVASAGASAGAEAELAFEEIPSAPAETPAELSFEEIPDVSAGASADAEAEPAFEEIPSTPADTLAEVEASFEKMPSVSTVAEEPSLENTVTNIPEPAPAPVPPVKKPVSKTNRPIEEYPEYEQGILNDGGWECAFCERINANYITTCACGHSEDDSFLKRRGKYVNPETGEVEPAPAAPEEAAPAATETAAPATPTPEAPTPAAPAAELTPAEMIAEIEQELAADSSEMAKFRAIRKYKNLVKKGYMTKEEFNKKQDELLSFEDDDAMAAPESSGEDNA